MPSANSQIRFKCTQSEFDMINTDGLYIVDSPESADSKTGSFSVTLPHRYAQPSGDMPYQCQVIIKNASGDATKTIDVIVPFAPADPGPVVDTHTVTVNTDTMTATVTGSGHVVGGVFADAYINWGDGSALQSIPSQPTSTLTWNLSHEYSAQGVYEVRVTLVDNNNLTATAMATANLDIADPPVIDAFNVTKNSSLGEFGVSANGSAHPVEGTITSCLIDWGDGSTPDEGMQSSPPPNVNITGSHVYPDYGTYTVTLTVICSNGATAVTTRNINFVNNHFIINFNVTKTGDSSVSAYCDMLWGRPYSDGILITLDWGDGNVENIVPPAGNAIGYQPTKYHSYSSAGNYTITLTVTDTVNNVSDIEAYLFSGGNQEMLLRSFSVGRNDKGQMSVGDINPYSSFTQIIAETDSVPFPPRLEDIGSLSVGSNHVTLSQDNKYGVSSASHKIYNGGDNAKRQSVLSINPVEELVNTRQWNTGTYFELAYAGFDTSAVIGGNEGGIISIISVTGDNNSFKFGNPPTTQFNGWTALTQNTDGIVDISIGPNFVYGVFGTERQLKICGSYTNGQAGNGSRNQVTTFSNAGSMVNVTKVKAGGTYGLCLVGTTLWATGSQSNGPLGTGQIVGGDPTILTWTQTLTGVDVFDVSNSTTQLFSAASVGGQLKVTGDNSDGQLGLGDSTRRYVWTDVPGLTNVTDIACGENFMAVIDGGQLKVAGNNSHQQFGNPMLGQTSFNEFQTIPKTWSGALVGVKAMANTLFIIVNEAAQSQSASLRRFSVTSPLAIETLDVNQVDAQTGNEMDAAITIDVLADPSDTSDIIVFWGDGQMYSTLSRAGFIACKNGGQVIKSINVDRIPEIDDLDMFLAIAETRVNQVTNP